MDLGVYVHFPYCRARCPYCDFAIAIAPLDAIPHRSYADAVLAELAVRAPRFSHLPLRTIYFGGGTPALWNPAEIARVISTLRASFASHDLSEITLEANPLDCTPARLESLLAAGITRLSIGAQSFSDSELTSLGRDHDSGAAIRAIATAAAAGFTRISADLIYALPTLTLGDWERTLVRAANLPVDHLSVYQLTIEPRTPFGEAARAGRFTAAPDDDCAAQFEAAHARLTTAGFEHYEVSSYARPGARAVHNSRYWTGVPYLGLGNGAHSFFTDSDGESGLRWSAHRSINRYLAGTPDADLERCGLVAERTPEDAVTLREDRIWLGMRTSDGVPRALLGDGSRADLEALSAAKLVTVTSSRVAPTPRGMLFADEIGARLLR